MRRTLIYLLFVLTIVGAYGQEKKNRLPLMQSLLEGREQNFPKPVGVTGNLSINNLDLIINELEVSARDADPTVYSSEQLTGSRNDYRTTTYTFSPDIWLLPFMNVYGTVGYLEALSRPTFQNLEGSEGGSNGGLSQEEVRMTGYVWGFGTALVYKFGPIWTSADFTWTWTNLDIIDEHSTARNIRFRVGHTLLLDKTGKHKLSAWGGAAHLRFNAFNQGSYGVANIIPGDLPPGQDQFAGWIALGNLNDLNMDPTGEDFNENMGAMMAKYPDPLSEDITFKTRSELKQKWSALVGVQYQYNDQWMARIEQGFLGDRNYTSFSATYRFDW